MKILISTSSFAEYDRTPLDTLMEHELEFQLNPHKRTLSGEELTNLCQGCAGLIAGTERITADVLQKLSELKVISRCGVGVENVDITAADKLGIKVFNTPDAPTLAVAELTIGLMLNLLRKVCDMDRKLRNGHWQKKMGNLLFCKKIGIVGFGRVGKKVAEFLKPFGCEIAYADPFVEDGLMELKRLSLEELLVWADIVSIHVSGNEKLLGKREFKIMKKGAWLVNSSRGGIVDEDALHNALKAGDLSGAALDVFAKEPYNGSLKDLNSVILTPHIGSYAKEARIQMETQAVENLLKGLKEVA
ncbi:MAG: phosphoglycerate dehydrogenase [Thermodesulfobacteriota bacterium]